MRLSDTTLATLPAPIRRPAYDRSGVTAGVVHLGIGAFHRAHQAVYLDDCIARGETGWGLIGASLRHPGTRDALGPQDGLYAVQMRSGAGDASDETRVVGSVLDLIVAPEDPARLVRRMADPGIRIVTLTVTEKGICHDPATGTLREDHPDILHDIADPGAPRSAPGLLLAALRLRREAGEAPFTILSCDNLPANGATVKRVLARMAQLAAEDLAAWVEGEVACPGTMVDRIVPATTDEDRARIGALLGVEDAWPVVAEPFSQWVIEDAFPLGRPDLAAVGAQLVSDVAPYEAMKLRLLNGSHSALAYLGLLAGHATVARCMADEPLARLVRAMMDEVAPTLRLPRGTDLPAYQDALLARFRNPALEHRTAQIAMDGSQKLPQRLLGPIRDRLVAGAPFERLALALAAWMACLMGRDEAGRAIEMADPMGERLRAIAREAGPAPERLAPALITVREMFGDDLPADPRFREAVTRALGRLSRDGASRSAAALGT